MTPEGLKEKMVEKSFVPIKLEQSMEANGISEYKPKSYVELSDALAIAQQYASDMCKEQSGICASEYVVESGNNNTEWLVSIQTAILCSPLATEEGT